ncbi:hypothetical protein AVEN_62302-1 [Araneus ventricosus]|uniref:Uncharacterized protein n=1 Tax=Araneus ventricosus TaxID=182803 RepID=A0A4Y2X410_ARAVE|nr:hypothetical protein AVEN_62302-1 [Araneus ventricosus]
MTYRQTIDLRIEYDNAISYWQYFQIDSQLATSDYQKLMVNEIQEDWEQNKFIAVDTLEFMLDHSTSCSTWKHREIGADYQMEK